jgi:hypothetical protein
MIGEADLNIRFGYHPPSSEDVKVDHETIRGECYWLANVVDRLCPDSREKSTAITKIEEAMMWANAAIARSPENRGISPEATVSGDTDRKDQPSNG